MNAPEPIRQLLARYVEHHVQHGERLSCAELGVEDPRLADELGGWIARYHELDGELDAGRTTAPSAAFSAEGAAKSDPDELPALAGFRTIERLGCGGMGEVWKARDLELNRIVAIKVLRRDRPGPASYPGFLREARSLALFRDRRIVQIHDYRADHEPPFLVMEFVDGFDLGSVARSLEPRQRAKILLEICEAVQHAHDVGIQHRDLKPANVLLDASLTPRLLDFGLGDDRPDRGHLIGTLHYLAPEQLDVSRAIDTRTDVYALGVMFYELLCGERPFDAGSDDAVLEAIVSATPRLPVEIDPGVPEPLQAIALKAMERDPGQRYASARAMAEDLRRYLQSRPVLARPSLYASALGQRVRPHLEQIRDWLQLRLIHPHEAAGLQREYARLDSREDDWIAESRVLSYSQISLYLGAFLLLCGGLLYFVAHRVLGAVEHAWHPILALGLPVVGLEIAGRGLRDRGHRAVAVAFRLSSVLLLPLLLVVLFHEAGLFRAGPEAMRQLFDGDVVSNRQLQVATLVAWAWCSRLAMTTRTAGLGSLATLLLTVFGLTVLTDAGLRSWIEEGRWDRLALHLVPVLGIHAGLGWWLERRDRLWFSRSLYLGAGVLGIVTVELLALNGKAFDLAGFSMTVFHGGSAADAVLLDTLIAMVANGALIYVAGGLIDRYGTPAMRATSWLMIVVSPFAILQPAGYLVSTALFSDRYNWLYLGLSIALCVLSRHRQRLSFYLAGVLNTGIALFFISLYEEWFDRPAWAVSVLGLGLAALALGCGLALRERSRPSFGPGTADRA